jgi:hypothetical protein
MEKKRLFSILDLLAEIRTPLLVLVIVWSYAISSSFGIAPTPERVSEAMLVFFKRYGTAAVVPICFLENFAPVNSWFPGSLAILTAMASTAGDPAAAIRMFFAIWFSALIGLGASFVAGRRIQGSNTSNSHSASMAETKIRSWIITLLMFVHPYTGSLHTFRAGAKRIPFLRAWLPILVAHSLWSIFWGVTTYTYGLWLYEGSTLFILIWAYLIGWILFDTIRYCRGVRWQG